MTEEIDRTPSRFSTVVAIGAAFVAATTSVLGSTAGLFFVMPAVLAIVLSLYLGSRRGLAFGITGLLAGAMIAGLDGAPAPVVLVSVAAAVLTWDYASMAIGVGQQLGRRTPTERLEKLHAVTSAGVAVATIVISVGIYQSIARPSPVAAVFFLLLAAILLVGALR